MCDTIVALPNYTKCGGVLFAKNSDRAPNEPQVMQFFQSKDIDISAQPLLKLTYIEIPQVSHTNGIVISRPSWMWGAEMGSNEFGLTIGNEAVFTREKYIKEPSITGMDMVRLALERRSNAADALDFLIDLLGKYNQGGNCGYGKQFYYHNSFLIADTKDAYVLETAGKYWVSKKVSDYFAISNCLCLSEYDRCHPELIKHAIEQKWCKSEADFDFVKCYTEPIFTKYAKGNQRRAVAMEKLSKRQDHDEKTFIGILRTHSGKACEGFNEVGSICMHAGGIIGDNTTASFVADLGQNECLYYATGSSLPCASIFKPFLFNEDMPWSKEGDDAKGVEYWQSREKLMRYFISGAMSILEFKQQARILEEVFIDEFKVAKPENKPEIIQNAFEQEARFFNRYLQVAKTKSLNFTRGKITYRIYWKRQTKNLLK